MYTCMVKMRATIAIFLLTILFVKCFASDTEFSEVDCSELKHIRVLGAVFISLSSKSRQEMPVSFYLSTRKHKTPIYIDVVDWAALREAEFDPSKKTFIIIHGYKSGGRKSWVLDLTNKLLDARDGNVILVDWSSGSNTKNYVNAARNTQIATNRIFNFLQTMRYEVELLNRTSGPVLWNHLHFIGHSLGAQISGQTAHFLREDKFWTVERITGLDPAKPCFSTADASLRIDRADADFVDIIHTQSGTGRSTDSLGLKESIGHIDFYVNGGTVQPQCVGSFFNPRWNTMICSHKLAYTYFTESLTQPLDGSCKFLSYPWDGSYEEAHQILNQRLIGIICHDCPEMGINASKSKKRGSFIVFTSEEKPYCAFNDKDLKKLVKVFERLKDSKPISSH